MVFTLPEIDPDNLMKKEHFKDFKLKVKYKRVCQCLNTVYPTETCLICMNYLLEEKSKWLEIHHIIKVQNFNLGNKSD